MVQDGHLQTCVSILPRFLLNDSGEYVISIKYDEDGDVEVFENKQDAVISTSILNTKRFEKLKIELMEAAKAIVNPPNAGG